MAKPSPQGWNPTQRFYGAIRHGWFQRVTRFRVAVTEEAAGGRYFVPYLLKQPIILVAVGMSGDFVSFSELF